MRAQIEILKEVFEEWLRIHGLDYDYWIYTPEEWKVRGEKYLNDAGLVIILENQLFNIFEFLSNGEIEDELQDLAGGFGYYLEKAYHCMIGFYPLDEVAPLPPANASYAELLNDPRWSEKRCRIIERSGGRCEECGSQDGRLEVHHCYYRFGRFPWQYPDASLLALCRDCHKLVLRSSWSGAYAPAEDWRIAGHQKGD